MSLIFVSVYHDANKQLPFWPFTPANSAYAYTVMVISHADYMHCYICTHVLKTHKSCRECHFIICTKTFLSYVQSFSCSAIYIFGSNLCGLHLHGHICSFRKELYTLCCLTPTNNLEIIMQTVHKTN